MIWLLFYAAVIGALFVAMAADDTRRQREFELWWAARHPDTTRDDR